METNSLYSVISQMDGLRVYPLPTPSPPSLPPVLESYDDHRSQHTPLIIDNGSTTLRWGFSTSQKPQVGINAVAKYKERRNNKPLLLFGEAIDAESGAKGQARTPWEGDVLLNFDALVCHSLFLGVRRKWTRHFGDVGKRPRLCLYQSRCWCVIRRPPDFNDRTIMHPFTLQIMWVHSVLCSSRHSKTQTVTSELMFEQYSVPSLAYCVDGVMSFYQNNLTPSEMPFTSDGLVISFNTASTSVIPILGGKGIMSHAKRFVLTKL